MDNDFPHVIDSWYIDQAKKDHEPVLFFFADSREVVFFNHPIDVLFTNLFGDYDTTTTVFDQFFQLIGEQFLERAKSGKVTSFHLQIPSSKDFPIKLQVQLLRIPPFSKFLLQARIIDSSETFANLQDSLKPRLSIEVILENLGFGYYDWDVQAQTIYMDKKMYEIYGVPEEAKVNSFDFLSSIIHPEDSEKLRREYERLFLSNEKPKTDSTTYRIRKNNTYHHIHSLRAYHYNPDGKLFRIVGICQDVTKEAIAKEKVHSHLVSIDLLSEAVIETDGQYVIKSWNKGATQIYGWEEKEVLGKRFPDICPTSYVNDSRENVLQKYHRNGHWKGEVIHLHKSGKPLHILSSVKSVIDPVSKQAISAVGVNTDISARVKIEKALRKTEERYRSFVESSLDAFFLIESIRDDAGEIVDFRIVDVNDEAIRQLKQPKEALLGKKVLELFPFKKDNGFFDRYKSVVNTGKPSLHEYYKNQGPTTHGWFQQQVIKVLDGAAIMNRNITETKEANIALEESQRRQLLINKAAQVGIWYWDLASETLHWDEMMLRVYGIERKDFHGKVTDWTSRVHPDDVEEADRRLQENVANNLDHDIQFRIILPDQSVRFIKSFAIGLKDSEGNLFQILGTNWDVTKEKEAEETRLQTLNLRQKNKELEQFAYVASHDLQEPLQTIRSFVDLLRKDLSEQKLDLINVYMDYIEQVSDRMSSLVKDLLDYARIGKETGIQEVDTAHLVNSILQDFKALSELTNAKFSIGNLPVLHTYRAEMRLLFQNLISNAMKFRKEDLIPQISISASKKPGEWLFSVSDNGIGIAPEDHEQVFILFKRLHPRKKYEGTGIGLAHCQKIVDFLGGRLWLESELTKGSTFYFTIPDPTDEGKTELHSPD